MIERLNILTSKVKEWVKNNRAEALLIALVLLIGAFLRLYRIDEYMTFLGDEGRDAIIVRRLWTNFDPILIGPRTSIGDMYLGPLYYYLIAPALLLAGFSPAGPSILIALIGVATIYFVWYVAREWFGKVAAIVSALLYSLSPVVIVYSRSSWNPNIMPFFSLLAVYAIWRVWKKHAWRWLIVLGVSFAFILQSHYLGLLLAPAVGLFWLFTLVDLKRKQKTGFVRYSAIGLALFLLLMSPLVLFDARHGWRNFGAMKKFFTERQTTVSARPWTAIPDIPNIALQTNASLVGAHDADLTWVVTYGLFFAAAWIVVEKLFSKRKIQPLSKSYWLKMWQLVTEHPLSEMLVILVWLGVAYIGLGLYKQHVYDHYFGFFFAAPFLLIGAVSAYVFDRKGIFLKLLVALVVIYAVVVNFNNRPTKYPPNRQMQRTIEVAEKIRQEAGGAPLNLAVIAERNYEDAYQYFLEKWRTGVVDINPEDTDATITDQLFVVCELAEEKKCDPTHNPKAEVANFGWSEIENEWQVAGVYLFKLVHVDL